MKKTVLLLLFVSSISHADYIECTFTEPFFDTIYNTSKSTLTYVADEYTTMTMRNVSLQIKAAGVFDLVARDGKVLQTLTLNYKGSNGMSETIYPYEVKDTSNLMTKSPIYGGCVSNHLKSKEPKP